MDTLEINHGRFPTLFSRFSRFSHNFYISNSNDNCIRRANKKHGATKFVVINWTSVVKLVKFDMANLFQMASGRAYENDSEVPGGRGNNRR